MAARAQLEVQGASPFTFDVEGEWLPICEPVYREASHPSRIIGYREGWEFRGCRISGTDATDITTQFAAFKTRFESMTTHPTKVDLRVPGGAVLLTLDSTAYEQFRLEVIQGETDPDSPEASWVTTGYLTVRFSAVKRFADTDGIVGWEQEVDISYPNGLRTMRRTTTVTTLEGTSAVTKAQQLTPIDITVLPTATYTEDTNGPDGIAYLYSDADERDTPRIPTICRAVSATQEWGIAVGATGGGVAPSSIGYSTTVKTTPDEVITTTEAVARGPNGAAFVAARAPAAWVEREILTDDSTYTYRGTWISRTQSPAAQALGLGRIIRVRHSGGFPVQRWRSITGGLPPLRSIGGILRGQTVVEVSVKAVGIDGKPSELLLPGKLPDPYILNEDASEEGEPEIEEEGVDATQDKWIRTAKLVYHWDRRPTTPVLEALKGVPDVASYFLQVT